MKELARRGFFAIVGAALSAVLNPFKRAKPTPVPAKSWIERFVERAREGGAVMPSQAVPHDTTRPSRVGALIGRYVRDGE